MVQSIHFEGPKSNEGEGKKRSGEARDGESSFVLEDILEKKKKKKAEREGWETRSGKRVESQHGEERAL